MPGFLLGNRQVRASWLQGRGQQALPVSPPLLLPPWLVWQFVVQQVQ
jgi:hypothetical protein